MEDFRKFYGNQEDFKKFLKATLEKEWKNFIKENFPKEIVEQVEDKEPNEIHEIYVNIEELEDDEQIGILVNKIKEILDENTSNYEINITKDYIVVSLFVYDNDLNSNQVFETVAKQIRELGFEVETEIEVNAGEDKDENEGEIEEIEEEIAEGELIDNIINETIEAIDEKIWVQNVKTKWSPPPGLFTKDAKTIATVLKKESKNLKQAMARLNFYINRAGKKLSKERREELEKAKKILKQLYGEE